MLRRSHTHITIREIVLLTKLEIKETRLALANRHTELHVLIIYFSQT